MNDDLLHRAARALADTEPAPRHEIDATRARIMATLHQTRRRRTTLVSLLLPIAAVLVGSTAWAMTSGRLPALVAVLRGDHVAVTHAPPPKTRAAPSVPAPTEAPGERVPSPIEPPAPTASEAPAPTASEPFTPPRLDALAPRHAKERAATPSAPQSQRRVAAPAEKLTPVEPGDDDDLYRAAHEAHFVAHDPAKALAAWDAYLAAAPRGRFAPEARYNRALTLVRLRRTAEARAELEPFARGAYGAYRRDEARRLLDGLSAAR